MVYYHFGFKCRINFHIFASLATSKPSNNTCNVSARRTAEYPLYSINSLTIIKERSVAVFVRTCSNPPPAYPVWGRQLQKATSPLFNFETIKFLKWIPSADLHSFLVGKNGKGSHSSIACYLRLRSCVQKSLHRTAWLTPGGSYVLIIIMVLG